MRDVLAEKVMIYVSAENAVVLQDVPGPMPFAGDIVFSGAQHADIAEDNSSRNRIREDGVAGGGGMRKLDGKSDSWMLR